MNENKSLSQLAGSSWTETDLFFSLAALDDNHHPEESAPSVCIDSPKQESTSPDRYSATGAPTALRSLPVLLSPVRELQPNDIDEDASLNLSDYMATDGEDTNNDCISVSYGTASSADAEQQQQQHAHHLHLAACDDSAPNDHQQHQHQPHQAMMMNLNENMNAPAAGNNNSDLTQQEIDDILCNLVNNQKQIAAEAPTASGGHTAGECLPMYQQQEQNDILVYASTSSNNNNVGGGNEVGVSVTVDNGLMEYLQMAAPCDNIMVLNDVQTISDQQTTNSMDNFTVRMKCFNCGVIFTLQTFEQHICDYNEHHELIPDFVDAAPADSSVSVATQVNIGGTGQCLYDADEADAVVPGDNNNARTFATKTPPETLDRDAVLDEFAAHPVHKVLEANSAFVHKWLKTEYKLDLSVKPGEESTIAGGGNKKSEGPHVCDQCDRKFVHATGLARHLEKHDHDKTTATSGSGAGSNLWSMALWTGGGGSGGGGSDAAAILDTVTKCMLCARVFRLPEDALRHLDEEHRCMQPANMRDVRLLMDFSDSEEDEKDPLASDSWDPQLATKPPPAATHTGSPFSDADFKDDARHLRCIVVSSVLQCEFCDLLFVDMAALLRHSATHDPRHGYACRACCIRVPTVRDLFTHWHRDCAFERFEADRRRSPVQRLFVCNVCENKFTSPAQLYEHRRTSYHLFPRLSSGGFGSDGPDGTKSLCFACAECGHLTDTAKAAVVHQAEHHVRTRANGRRARDGETSTATATAGKGTSAAGGGGGRSKTASTAAAGAAGAADIAASADGGDLNVSKYRQYLCDVCGKSYTQSSHLWQHLRFHKGVKPFACKEPDCTRRFTIRPDLNDHIRKCHTGERPYHCQICGKRFLTGSVFYQHRLIHRGERRYGCDDCGKRFYRADALKNHQRIHTGEKPYACTQCQKKFRQRGDRDKHVRARHNNGAAVAAGAGAPGTSGSAAGTASGAASGSRANRAGGSSLAAARGGRGGGSGSMVMSLAGLPVPAGGAAARTAAAGGPRGRIRSKKDLLMQPRPTLPMQQQQLIGNIPVGYTGGVNSRGRMPTSAVVATQQLPQLPVVAPSMMGLEDVVYVGNMAFPTSMFRPMVADIDGNGLNLF